MMQSIFKYFTVEEDKETALRIIWFVDSFPAKEFSGLDKFIYFYLEYCARLGIVAKRNYLNAFLRTDGKRLILENNIKLDNMAAYDYTDPAALEESYRVITSTTIQFYENAIAQDITENEFKVVMDTWMKNQKLKLLKLSMTNNFPRASQGEDVDEVTADLMSDLEAIQNNYNEQKLEELDFLGNKASANKVGSGEMIFISKTHFPAIDGDVGGIFKSMILTFTGLTGSGKSRFIFRCFGYVAAVFFKVSVRIDSLELTKSQVENILIAMHIATLFKVKIPDSLMNKDALDETQLRYYHAAKEDLFNNKEGKYGSIYISDKVLYIEDFRSKVMRFLRLHKDIQIWIIDYAGLIRSNPKGFKRYSIKAEIIEEAYATAREISTNTGLAWVFINQYNREGALKAKAGKSIDQGDIEGGQTVHKYTDYNIYSTQTEEQKSTSLQLMTADKVRGAKGFNKVPVKSDLSISKFDQMAKVITS